MVECTGYTAGRLVVVMVAHGVWPTCVLITYPCPTCLPCMHSLASEFLLPATTANSTAVMVLYLTSTVSKLRTPKPANLKQFKTLQPKAPNPSPEPKSVGKRPNKPSILHPHLETLKPHMHETLIPPVNPEARSLKSQNSTLFLAGNPSGNPSSSKSTFKP